MPVVAAFFLSNGIKTGKIADFAPLQLKSAEVGHLAPAAHCINTDKNDDKSAVSKANALMGIALQKLCIFFVPLVPSSVS